MGKWIIHDIRLTHLLKLCMSQKQRFDCPGGGEEFPNALMDPPTGRVYIGCGKYVYCLQARTGVIIWQRKVSKSIIPGGYMVLATASHNAQANSSFNQFPVPHVNEEG